MNRSIPSTTILARAACLLVACSVLSDSLVSALSSPSSLKIRVCQGSGCLGKCRGAFDPLESFEKLAAGTGDSDGIRLEETFCMNQCKRGPNVRMINADNGNVLVFDDAMNETEAGRKAFQGVSNDGRVEHLWGIANQLLAKGASGSPMEGVAEKGSADKLNDIMPTK
ncbi:unnamed protein product [Pseudo-nitzschia multistriata]|uniref:Uncharacterized protein n=1 Tax=Pseudo-nitzschia multistriata TaxID=183589 RepID=A0A448ZD64_9STRA|nr:unnamed protein product [Pseudo-nitzschia multistriata]